MARLPRLCLPGIPQHIIQRGTNRQAFQKIKAKVRCNLAKNLLVNSDIPVTSIAGKIGFAEPGNFTRAFIAWTGQTPSRYRAEQGRT